MSAMTLVEYQHRTGEYLMSEWPETTAKLERAPASVCAAIHVVLWDCFCAGYTPQECAGLMCSRVPNDNTNCEGK